MYISNINLNTDLVDELQEFGVFVLARKTIIPFETLISFFNFPGLYTTLLSHPVPPTAYF